MTEKIELPLGRTTMLVHGANRWFDKLPKLEEGDWPLVITFSRKSDRLAFLKALEVSEWPELGR